MKLLFVVNPISGDNDKKGFLDSLEGFAYRYIFEYDLFLTTGNHDKKQLNRLVNREKPDIVVAVGGDGTVLLVAEVVMHTNIRLGIIPYGSANGMAAELNIPNHKEEALKVLLQGKSVAIDNLKINQTHNCIHIGDIGFNARMVKRFETDRMRGFKGYAKQFFKEFSLSKKIKVDIQTEKKRYTKSAHMIAFANARRYGTKALLNPIGKLDDGYFELCILKDLSVRVLFLILLSWFTGSMYKTRFAEIIRCKKARIQLHKNKRMTVQVDGEVIGDKNTISIDVEPSCLHVMVPKEPSGKFLDLLVAEVEYE
ncbi:diacylglycerol kinase family protein [Rapidithrix thailandica]|uniref:Diacylglycerol kinase family protein n=1 Tax=Rapidithrix thailandica TaxID=413964 RepID=A0AAW9S895_9BACT